MKALLISIAAIASLGLAGAAGAQASLSAALASGAVGEQIDGYLGFPKPPSGDLKAEVDAINIKRRQVYTQAAQAKNVSIEAFAVSTGCTTLGKLASGRAYSVAPGVWSVKGAGAVSLPSTCG